MARVLRIIRIDRPMVQPVGNCKGTLGYHDNGILQLPLAIATRLKRLRSGVCDGKVALGAE